MCHGLPSRRGVGVTSFTASRRVAPPPQPPRQITANLFGGKFYADGWVAMGPEPRYALNATLTDADLARTAKSGRGVLARQRPVYNPGAVVKRRKKSGS